MIQKKVCMVGAFAVGKTSLVARFVHDRYSEKYLTTVGVKVDRRDVAVDGRQVRLMLWDLAGEDELMPVRMSYLRGADGCLVVIDGTRAETVAVADTLFERIRGEHGDIPLLLVANKADLSAEWEVDLESLDGASGSAAAVCRTSAKTGEGVAEAFERLAREILGRAS